MEIEKEKTEQRSGQRSDGDGEFDIPAEQCGHESGGACQQRDACGQAVNTINQIHGVGATRQPYDSHDCSQPGMQGKSCDISDLNTSEKR